MESEIERIVRMAKPIKERAQRIRELIERGELNYPRLSKISKNYPQRLCVVAIDTGLLSLLQN